MSDTLLSASHGPAARPVAVVTGKRLLLALGLWLLAAAVIGTATMLAARRISMSEATPIIVAEVYALLIAALVLVMRPHTAKALGLLRCNLANVGLAAVTCGGAYLVTAAFQTAVAPWPWSSAIAILKAMGSDDGRLATASQANAAIIIVRACVLAAFAEEILFRGVLYTWLRQRFPAKTAIPLSAAAHAAIHGFPAILPLAFVMGIGFGWVRERSGSTVPTIVVHALHNAALIVLAYQLAGWTARLPAWKGS